ncbi:MAG TPA: radical SAM family heme chaperone HemW [Gemmatimonadaceae bacterium]
MARHVYVHVPFCARRCSYCDFAIAVRRTVPIDEYLDALEREIRLRVGEASFQVDTMYLGGGTPSRLGPQGITRLLDLVRLHFAPVKGAEITIEANPEDVDPNTASHWRQAGITRVSLGVQSFDDDVLRWMHRTHDTARVTQAAAALRAAGFDDWSLDLIFALPPEVRRSWTDDLRRAIDVAPAHISCYGLTVEPHTPLMRWRDRGQVHDAEDERYEQEFLQAHEALGAAGFEHYEVSNFARPGRQARHNSAYWRRVPYVGFGPSAHSFDGMTRRWNTREYAAWRDRILQGLDPVEGAETLEPEAVTIEEAYLGLRTSGGVPVSPRNKDDLSRWSDQGWAIVVDGIARLTPTGWLRLDALVADLTDLRSH